MFAVTCPVLASIQNGTTILTTDGVSTSSSFTCDLGFMLKGQETITCDSSGVWGDQPPTCGKAKTILMYVLCYKL